MLHHLQRPEEVEGEPEPRWGEVGVAGGHYLGEGVPHDASGEEGQEQEQGPPSEVEGGDHGPLLCYSELPLDGRGVGGQDASYETAPVACSPPQFHRASPQSRK